MMDYKAPHDLSYDTLFDCAMQAAQENDNKFTSLLQATHAFLAYIDEYPYRLTSQTFWTDAEQARKLIENLRAALSEVES